MTDKESKNLSIHFDAISLIFFRKSIAHVTDTFIRKASIQLQRGKKKPPKIFFNLEEANENIDFFNVGLS